MRLKLCRLSSVHAGDKNLLRSCGVPGSGVSGALVVTDSERMDFQQRVLNQRSAGSACCFYIELRVLSSKGRLGAFALSAVKQLRITVTVVQMHQTQDYGDSAPGSRG